MTQLMLAKVPLVRVLVEAIESHMSKGFTERISVLSQRFPQVLGNVRSLRSHVVASSQVGSYQEKRSGKSTGSNWY